MTLARLSPRRSLCYGYRSHPRRDRRSDNGLGRGRARTGDDSSARSKERRDREAPTPIRSHRRDSRERSFRAVKYLTVYSLDSIGP